MICYIEIFLLLKSFSSFSQEGRRASHKQRWENWGRQEDDQGMILTIQKKKIFFLQIDIYMLFLSLFSENRRRKRDREGKIFHLEGNNLGNWKNWVYAMISYAIRIFYSPKRWWRKKSQDLKMHHAKPRRNPKKLLLVANSPLVEWVFQYKINVNSRSMEYHSTMYLYDFRSKNSNQRVVVVHLLKLRKR